MTDTVGGRAGLYATSSSYGAFSRHHSFPALLNVPATEFILSHSFVNDGESQFAS